ncbi:endolysin [Mesorhizobium phage Cp1R7A-A1]|nr:endolysin [Mesorhizobium phage Cp1R7A-A1]
MATKKLGATASAVAAIAMAVGLAKPMEGYRGYVYRDPIGVLTYCYGETENAKAMQGKKFSETECAALLTKRMAHYAQGNEKCVPGYNSLPTPVQAAFDDFSYNVGNGAFCKSTAAKLLSAGKLREACGEFKKWIFAGGRPLPGLVHRRNLEEAMCLKGV